MLKKLLGSQSKIPFDDLKDFKIEFANEYNNWIISSLLSKKKNFLKFITDTDIDLADYLPKDAYDHFPSLNSIKASEKNLC
ncbi:MAG: hypothetical protein WCT85_01845 [Parachlamydiales bacterium]|jgi:hypothetical protein